MSTEANKALLRRYIQDVCNQGNLAALDDYLAADYQRHVSPTAPPLTLDGQKQRLAGFQSAFPDIALTLEGVIAEGDRVVFRSTMRGTHDGAFQGIPPAGTRVTVGLRCPRARSDRGHLGDGQPATLARSYPPPRTHELTGAPPRNRSLTRSSACSLCAVADGRRGAHEGATYTAIPSVRRARG